MKQEEKALLSAAGGTVIFILMLVWYTSGVMYPGPWPIVLVSGLACAAQLFALICTVRAFLHRVFSFSTVMTALISLPSALFTGYFFFTAVFLKTGGVW